MCKYGLFWPMPVCLSMVCSGPCLCKYGLLWAGVMGLLWCGVMAWCYYGVVCSGLCLYVQVWFVRVSACMFKYGLRLYV